MRFSSEGSRQLKLIWAKLALQGPECIGPTFSRSRIKRRGQREKVAISNRLPRFQIKPYSAIVGLVSGTVCAIPTLEEPAGVNSYFLLITSQLRVSCREHQVQFAFLEW